MNRWKILLTPSLNTSKIWLLTAKHWSKFVDSLSQKTGTAANTALPVITQKYMSKQCRKLWDNYFPCLLWNFMIGWRFVHDIQKGGGWNYVHRVTDGVGATEQMYIIHISETLQLMPDGATNQNASTYTYLPPEDVSSYFF